MFALVSVIISSLAICFVLTPFFRDFFGFLGVMDKPDSQRKTHARPIPRVGGVALALTYFVALIALPLGWWRGLIDVHDPSVRLMARLLPALLIICVIGLLDDLRGLSPWQKIAGQGLAATYACWAGVHLATPVGFWAPTILVDLVSILWLVLCANAFNLIDGLDGLAAGVGVIASASLLMAALIHHNPGLALVITPLIGALLGFLYYNFNPASIFLGDCGSLLIGFLLGCYGLMWHQHATTGLGKAAPLIALAFPVFEVIVSISRRFLRKRPIFGSDRNHIHHRIVSLGLSHRKAALVLYGVSTLVAVLAVLQTILRPRLATVLLLLFPAVAYFGFKSLRYAEFGVLGQFLFAGELRRTLRAMIHLREYEESLAGANTLEECWVVLRNTCRETSFNYLALNLNGRYFEEEIRPASASSERLHISLSHSDEATFGLDPSLTGPAMLIAPLIQRFQWKVSRFGVSRPWLASDSIPPERLKANVASAR